MRRFPNATPTLGDFGHLEQQAPSQPQGWLPATQELGGGGSQGPSASGVVALLPCEPRLI